jgi:hypothetical protein
LPGDGDVDVDAEHAGEQGGGEFGGELEQGGGACLAGLDAEVFDAFAEVSGADRAAGSASGKQPGRGVGGAGGAVSAFAVQRLPGEVGDELGKGDGCRPDSPRDARENPRSQSQRSVTPHLRKPGRTAGSM